MFFRFKEYLATQTAIGPISGSVGSTDTSFKVFYVYSMKDGIYGNSGSWKGLVECLEYFVYE